MKNDKKDDLKKPPGKVRLSVGISLIVLSFILPVFSVWIVSSSLPVHLKSILVAVVSLGGPEVIALAAVAVLGKECFDLILAKIFKGVKRIVPAKGSVGKVQYRIGLAIFLLSFVPSYIFAYVPYLMSDLNRIYVCIGADIAFIASLFMLGGDFWDKLRSLFIYESKANFN